MSFCHLLWIFYPFFYSCAADSNPATSDRIIYKSTALSSELLPLAQNFFHCLVADSNPGTSDCIIYKSTALPSELMPFSKDFSFIFLLLCGRFKPQNIRLHCSRIKPQNLWLYNLQVNCSTKWATAICSEFLSFFHCLAADSNPATSDRIIYN